MSLGPEARARLHARFIAGLPDRLDAMLALRDRLQVGDPPAPAEARSFGHQYAGTGSSFGHPELTALGRALESATDERLLPALDALVAGVRTTIRQAAERAERAERAEQEG
jgi:HPt (histidine-containing phosphotransfer) domain-containing protein